MRALQQQKHENRAHVCNGCGKQTVSNLELTNHHSDEHGGRKYKCRYCEYRVIEKGTLSLHVQAVHEDVKLKLPCTHCNYKASSKSILTQHRRSVHEGVKYTLAGNVTMRQL